MSLTLIVVGLFWFGLGTVLFQPARTFPGQRVGGAKGAPWRLGHELAEAGPADVSRVAHGLSATMVVVSSSWYRPGHTVPKFLHAVSQTARTKFVKSVALYISVPAVVHFRFPAVVGFVQFVLPRPHGEV